MSFIDHIEADLQQVLYKYWRSKCGENHLPSRTDLKPEEVVPLLPNIGLIDVFGYQKFRYRLVGTAMVELFKQDFTGQDLEAAKSGEYMMYLKDLYQMAVDERCAVYSRSEFKFRDGWGLDTMRLILPLADEQQNINMLLFSTMPVMHEENWDDVLIIEDSIGIEEHQRVVEKRVVNGN